jgi:hypothetical protein
MTHGSCAFGADLRALMCSPAVGLGEYKSDPVVQRRVGRMLVEAAKRIASATAATPKAIVTAPALVLMRKKAAE